MNTPPSQQPSGGLTLPQGSNNGNARIKTEPGLENSGNGQFPPNYQPPAMITTAQQRAAQHLQQNYGQRAAASISAIQQGRGQPLPQNGQPMSADQMQQYRQMQQQAQQQQQAANQGLNMPQRPQPPQNGGSMTRDEYNAMMAANVRRQMQQQAPNGQNGQNGVGGAQTDGAADEVDGLAIIKRFDADGQEVSMGRIEIDGLIRRKIESMGSAMEGGGLMLPLQKASTASKRSRKVKRTATAPGQADGGDDDDDKSGVKDEELDEDAINSDLDDPDEGANEEEDEDEGMGHIMLCMYDKVQRVKNKW